MYHIKNDKRVRQSVSLICAALDTLMRRKEYNSITVSDIQHISGVSRSTFYRSFDTTDDILRLQCDRGFQEVFTLKNGLPISVNCFNYWFEHSNVMEALMKADHLDFFAHAFNNALLQSSLLGGQLRSEAEFYYFSSWVSYGMVGLLSGWIARGRKESKAELLQFVLRSCQIIGPAVQVELDT